MKSASACLLAVAFCGGVPSHAQNLSVVSGNGQVVAEQFATTAPLVVRALDAAGKPVTDLPVTFSVPANQGTIIGISTVRTDANGLASANFLGTGLQPGASYLQTSVTASSSLGIASFVITTTPSRTSSGQPGAPPEPTIITPQTYAVSGRAGSTVPAAITIRVSAIGGINQGQGIPNVGIRLAPTNPSPDVAGASCNGPAGIVLTDQTGLATCDLVLNRIVGTAQLTPVVGEYRNLPSIALTITPGEECRYTLSPVAQAFSSSAAMGTVAVTAATGCGYTASTSSNFITITSGGTGSGNGTVAYSVAANGTGAARTGTLTISGQTFTITQSASGTVGTALALATGANLLSATAGASYSATLTASGGTPPYTWRAATTLPPGLTLNATTGVLSGAVSAAGTYSFGVIVTDATAASASQTFSLVVSAVGVGGSVAITTTSLAPGNVGTAYTQPVVATGGCSTPFSGPPSVSLATGLLPPGLALQPASGGYVISGIPLTQGNYTFTLRASDACGASASRDFTLTITGTGAGAGLGFTALPATLTFSAQAGSASGVLPQVLTVSGGATSTPFTAAVTTASGGDWLSVTPLNGIATATLSVSVNAGSLPAGTYNGSVAVTPATGTSPITVSVILTVAAPMPAPVQTVSVTPGALTFDISAAANPASASKQLQVTGNVPGVRFNVTATTLSGGNWLIVTPGSAEAPAAITVTANAVGLASGTYNGSVSVVPVGNSAAVQTLGVVLNVTTPSTATVSPGVLNFSVGSGVAPVPQIITVGSTGAPVNFSISASVPWIGIASVDGTTPDVISISVNPATLQPGLNSGSVTIVPQTTRIPLTVPVNVTVTQAIPVVTAITNAATFAPGPVAPGEIVTLFGTNLGGTDLLRARVTSDNRLDTVLGDTRVLFDDIPAPLIYVSAEQVSAVVPYQLYGRSTVRIAVQRGNTQTNPRELRVVDAVPGIFILDSSGQGAILNQDNSVNGPQSGADSGSVISIFATGEGQTNPPGVNGRIAPGVASELAFPLLPVAAQVGDQKADVLYAGSAPGLPAGVVQVNVRLPAGVPRNSAVPVLITVGGFSSQPGVTVAIK